MNKSPEEMKINDALDLFEENGAKITFFKGRCNVDEQFGKVMRKRRLYNPTTAEEKKLVAQLGKAADLIYERLRDKTKKQELIDLLALREQYKPKENVGQTEPKRTGNSSQTEPKQTRTRENLNRRRRESEERQGEGRQDTSSTTSTSQNGNRKNGNLKIEYTRKKGQKCAGNTVQILEIPVDSKGINVPLKAGGKLRFSPPMILPELIQQFKLRTRMNVDPNIKRYLIIEMTPDKKTMFLNVVYGDLDLEQMSSNPKYLDLCMTTLLERKRINDICRNYFCTLDELLLDARNNVSLTRNDMNTYLVAATLLYSSDEIRTARKVGFFDSLFGTNQGQQEENILKIFKTGVIMVKGKECAVYSYGTKDETVDISERKMFEAGCFIVSGLDEERFQKDAKYREKVILNVLTPSRLKNSRRADIAYPYIGSVSKDGDFENDFEIYNELEGMQKQL